MADLDITTNKGFVDKRIGRGQTTSGVFATSANYDSIPQLKARLAAVAPTKYTAARLASMTKNDMRYALRLEDDAAGVK